LNKASNETRRECGLSGRGRKLHSGPTPRGLPESEDLVSTAWTEPAASNARSSDFDSHDILYACKRGCEGKEVGANESLFRGVPGKLAIRHTCLAIKIHDSGVEMENGHVRQPKVPCRRPSSRHPIFLSLQLIVTSSLACIYR
jgi:hypothetical protein